MGGHVQNFYKQGAVQTIILDAGSFQFCKGKAACKSGGSFDANCKCACTGEAFFTCPSFARCPEERHHDEHHKSMPIKELGRILGGHNMHSMQAEVHEWRQAERRSMQVHLSSGIFRGEMRPQV